MCQGWRLKKKRNWTTISVSCCIPRLNLSSYEFCDRLLSVLPNSKQKTKSHFDGKSKIAISNSFAHEVSCYRENFSWKRQRKSKKWNNYFFLKKQDTSTGSSFQGICFFLDSTFLCSTKSQNESPSPQKTKASCCFVLSRLPRKVRTYQFVLKKKLLFSLWPK